MKKTGYFLNLHGRFKRLLWLDAVMGLVIVLALVLAGLICSDAIFILPQSLRRAGLWLLGPIGSVFLLVRGYAIRKMNSLRLARLCENHDPELGSALTNALQLAKQPSTGGVNEVLREQALARGADKVRAVKLWPLAGPGLTRTGMVMTLILLAGLGGYFVFDSFFQSIIPRFFDPNGDHPPYSRLHLEVAVDKHEIVYGDDCEIRATATGLPVDKLYLVTRTASGLKKTVMFRRPDGSYFFTLTSLRAPVTLWITNGRARSRRHDIAILPTPIIKEITVKTEFPQYTGLQPLITPLADMKQQLPARSTLYFTIHSNRPLKGGSLELTPLLGGETRTVGLKPMADQQTMVSGGFVLEKPTAFSLNIMDIDGRLSQNPAKGRITISPDHPPRVFIEEPGIHALATPETSIPIRVRCEDDYGISAVRLFRGYNQSIEYPVEMKHRILDNSRGARAEGSFDFKDLGVRPGDVVNYYLEALDNNPDGPGLSLSRMFSIQVISEERYRHIVENLKHQKALFEHYFQVERILNRLVTSAEEYTEELRKIAGNAQQAAPASDPCEKFAQVQSGMGEYSAALENLFTQKPVNDIDADFRTKLYAKKLTFDLLRQRFNRLSAGANPACVLDPGEMTSLLGELTRMRGEVEKEIIEPAKHIAAVVNILAMANEFSKMAAAQLELAGLAHRFRDKTTGPSRLEQLEMSEINARQEKIRAGLNTFGRRLAELLEKLPRKEEFAKLRLTTEQFLAAIEQLEIQADLNQAVENWYELKGSRAYVYCQSGADKMQMLLQQSGQMGAEGKNCLQFMPAMKNAPGGALDQLLSSMGNKTGGSSNNGYGMYDENVGLYGSDMQIPGASNGPGDGERGAGSSSAYRIGSHDPAPEERDPKKQQEIKLPEGVEFPLRYRQLVGDYFKAIAESVQKEGEK